MPYPLNGVLELRVCSRHVVELINHENAWVHCGREIDAMDASGHAPTKPHALNSLHSLIEPRRLTMFDRRLGRRLGRRPKDASLSSPDEDNPAMTAFCLIWCVD